MSEFVLFRPPGALGPDFNEATKRLKANPLVLQIGDSQHEDTAGMALILISADDKAEDSLNKSLPGWTVGKRNGGVWG